MRSSLNETIIEIEFQWKIRRRTPVHWVVRSPPLSPFIAPHVPPPSKQQSPNDDDKSPGQPQICNKIVCSRKVERSMWPLRGGEEQL